MRDDRPVVVNRRDNVPRVIDDFKLGAAKLGWLLCLGFERDDTVLESFQLKRQFGVCWFHVGSYLAEEHESGASRYRGVSVRERPS